MNTDRCGDHCAQVSSATAQGRDNALRLITMIEAAPFGIEPPEISHTPAGTISFEWMPTEAHFSKLGKPATVASLR
jgi:hypothetical protein